MRLVEPEAVCTAVTDAELCIVSHWFPVALSKLQKEFLKLALNVQHQRKNFFLTDMEPGT